MIVGGAPAERKAFEVESAAIKEESAAFTSEKARKLVEQARSDSDELVFRSSQDLGKLHPERVKAFRGEIRA